MRATKAYIASAGTAAVMLAASLAMLAVVSAFVAFGSWPGQNAGGQIDQVVLADVLKPKPKKVAVRADAVQAARRAEARRGGSTRAGDGRPSGGRRQTRQRGGDGTRTPAPSPGTTQTPSGSAPTGRGNTVAATPGADPVSTVRNQAQGVTENLQTTTRDVGTQVQTQTQQVQTQVNEVVGQVVGDVQDTAGTTLQGVGDTVGGATDTVNNTVGGATDTVTKTAGSLLGH